MCGFHPPWFNAVRYKSVQADPLRVPRESIKLSWKPDNYLLPTGIQNRLMII